MTETITSATATAKTVRIAARKVRLAIDLIRGKGVDEALAILEFTPRGASPEIAKVLKSAIANAEHNFDLDKQNLYVKEAFVNEGPTLKRFRPRAKGSASPINKRTSHITVTVAEKEA
jgi:large subunit ribosomal protein L22